MARKAAPSVLPSETESKREEHHASPKSIFDYLRSLDEAVLSQLYQDTFTALTVFRSLAPLGKSYVMRLVGINQATKCSVIESWVAPTEAAMQLHKQSLQHLAKLRILLADSKDSLRLNPPFQQSLQLALCNRIPDLGERSLSLDQNPPSVTFLDEYSHERWQKMLHFMVGCDTKGRGALSVHGLVVERLVRMGLMERDKSTSVLITSAGFQFLFKDLHQQVWHLVMGYMSDLENRKLNRDEVIRFLLRLSFLKLGQAYPVAPLTESQQILLKDMTEFGLVYRPESVSNRRQPVGHERYYATRLALNLSPTAPPPGLIQKEGFIILETTFRVCAFTTSAFHTSLLRIFVRLDFKLPNVLIGVITKKSIRSALKSNITSNEIIHYLEQYAHPQLRQKSPILPQNVCDQIRLWEQERKRFTLREASMIEGFDNAAQYVEYKQLVEQKGFLFVSSEKDSVLVVDPASLSAVRSRREEERAMKDVTQ